MANRWHKALRQELERRGLRCVDTPDVFRAPSSAPVIRGVFLSPEARPGAFVPHIGYAVPEHDKLSFELVRGLFGNPESPTPTIMPLQRICAWRRYLTEDDTPRLPTEVADLIEEDIATLKLDMDLEGYVGVAISGSEFPWGLLGPLWLAANVLRINTALWGDPKPETLPPAMLDAVVAQHGRTRPAAYFIDRIVGELRRASTCH
jgi:hypothetical protein